jgi:hypothetical protein
MLIDLNHIYHLFLRLPSLGWRQQKTLNDKDQSVDDCFSKQRKILRNLKEDVDNDKECPSIA